MERNNMHTPRSLMRFYLYAICSGLQFTWTTWLAFVLAHGGNPGWAEAAFHLAIWLGEIPTGIVADLLGRKKSMLIGLFGGIVSAFGWFLIQDTLTACLVLGLSGLAGTFLSGADTALLYETASKMGGPELARKALARTSALRLGALAVAPAIGGLLYEWQDWAPAMAGVGVLVTTVLVVWGMVEQRAERGPGEAKPSMLGQAKAGLQVMLRNRATLSLVLLGWGCYTASSLVGQFGQALFPYAGLSMAVTGAVFTVARLASTGSTALAERLGASAAVRLLRFAPLGLGLAYLGMGLGGGWLGALCFVLGEGLEGLLDPVYNARLNESIPDAQRATVLSMHSSGVSMLMTVAFPAAAYLQPVTSIYVVVGAVAVVLALAWAVRWAPGKVTAGC
jgi:MFS family permease